MFAVIVVVRLVLHYLGWLGVLAGIVTLVFGNLGRAAELLIGGVGSLVMKYVIGFVYVTFFRANVSGTRPAEKPRVPREEAPHATPDEDVVARLEQEVGERGFPVGADVAVPDVELADEELRAGEMRWRRLLQPGDQRTWWNQRMGSSVIRRRIPFLLTVIGTADGLGVRAVTPIGTIASEVLATGQTVTSWTK